MHVQHLICNGNANPLGVDDIAPKLSWQLCSNQNETSQSAYQIQVAASMEDLSNGDILMWNTGKVASSTSIQISYAGKALFSAHYYYWKVRVWNQDDEPSDWSEISFWQMGLLTPADWGDAKWIGLEKQGSKENLVPGIFFKFLPKNFNRKMAANKLPQFRKRFSIKNSIHSASIFVAGLGHYEILLNGKNVSNDFLKAGWTNYEKSIFYNTYDITNQLQQGENVLGALLGNGMYNVPNERYFMLLTSFGYPKLIVQVRITYADGSVQEVVSDTTWKVTESPVIFSSIFGGEGYDANLEASGWHKANYNDNHWKNSVIIGDATDKLQPEIQPPLSVNHIFEPISVKEIETDTWVYDYGQNFSGIPSLEIENSLPSQEIRITPAELIDDNGDITTQNMWGKHYYNYKTKGETIEKWQPKFTFYGFRYLQIKGAVPLGALNTKRLPVVRELNGKFITSKSIEAGSFSTSNSTINDIYKLVKWGMRSNFASVMMDCPHREKLGWLEQAHLMAPSYQFEYDSYGFFKKIIKDMRDAQTPEGLVPCIAPEYTQFSPQYRESPEWGGAYILLPWDVYRFYGEVGVLKTHYEGMKKYLAYLQGRAENYLLNIGIGDWMDLGENAPGPSQLTPTDLVDTALFFQCTSTMQKVAEVLNYEEDALIFKQLAKNIKLAFNTKYYQSEKASYATGSQTALAMPLYVGLVPKEKEIEVLQSLKINLEKNNYQLTSGDIGHRYLLKTLEKHELSSYIFKMHTNPSQPSYAYQIAQGATALTESWQASRTASHNHCMLGHIVEWFYTGLAGIGQEENSFGFKNIIIKPQFLKEVGSIDVSFNCPYGLIKVSWKINGRETDLTVVIPANTSAKIHLPVNDLTTVLMNNNQLIKVLSDAQISIQHKCTELSVGSGDYSIQFIPY